MLGGLIVFGATIVLLCVVVFMAVLRTPHCPKCHLPLQPVAESVRALGMQGVETVIHYECSNCYRGTQRRLILTHPT
jgi:hypothetical protein